MRLRTSFALIAASLTILVLLPACKKETTGTDAPAPAAAPGQQGSVSASGLPGANEALTALDKKDYAGAIAGLIAVRQSVSTPQQQVQFATLVDEMKIRLISEAPNDPKAATALSDLRRITGGR